MRFVTNNLPARTHTYLMDTLCALTIVFPSVACVCSFCMSITPATPWSTWIAQCLQLRPTTSPSTTTVSMVMKITIRGRIFPKGGEMMRSILRSSPCTLRLLPKPQEDIRRDLEHTPLDTRLTRSSPNRHFPHVRHGYYLKHMCYAWPGTKRKTMEQLRSKYDRRREAYAKTEKKLEKTAGARMIRTRARMIRPQPGRSGSRPGRSG
jgi:hypothetical protein